MKLSTYRRIIPPLAEMGTVASWCKLLSVLALWAVYGSCSGSEATYRLDVDNTWSTQTHPELFPNEAHFSWLGGGLHNAEVGFWQEGQLASPGMKEMAETGVINMLVSEVDAMVPLGNAEKSLAYRWWFCPQETAVAQCGTT